MARLVLEITISDQDKPDRMKIVIDTDKGPSIVPTGTIYPADFAMINEIVRVIVNNRDRFPPATKERQ